MKTKAVVISLIVTAIIVASIVFYFRYKKKNKQQQEIASERKLVEATEAIPLTGCPGGVVSGGINGSFLCAPVIENTAVVIDNPIPTDKVTKPDLTQYAAVSALSEELSISEELSGVGSSVTAPMSPRLIQFNN